MKLDNLQLISACIAGGDVAHATDVIERLLADESGRDWNKYLPKLADTLVDSVPRFSIFAKDGNGKVPFLCWSSLPGKGFCPGAGACLVDCYSFKAQRYPAAYARQAQNSRLLQTADGRAAILAELDTFKPTDGGRVPFRLYVDGDFDSVETVDFWMRALRERPWLEAYGYSKSFRELLTWHAAGNEWPENYLLNLSGGHNHAPAIEQAMSQVVASRGRFVMVDVGHKVKATDHGNRAHQRKLREAWRAQGGGKAFTCPGKCGDCTPTGHACGSERFRGVDIIIAVH